MSKRTIVLTILILCVCRGVSAERWLIERGPGVGLAADDRWRLSAAELLVRRAFSELCGVTLISKPDVKSDVATLELNRLSSAKGEVRVRLGKFARATGLIVVGVGPKAQDDVTLRIIDLRQPDREGFMAGQLLETEQMGFVSGLMARTTGEFLGRPPTREELARIGRRAASARGLLTRDVLKALGKGADATTGAERELFLKQATMLAPDAPLAWYLYARQLHATGRALEAISAYRRAVKLDGGSVVCHYDLANAFFDEKRYAEAAAEYERAIALDPSHAASHENFIRTLKAQNPTPDKVLTKYRELAAAHKDVPVAHLQTARLLAAAGKLAEAVVEFRKAGDLDPRDPVCRFGLARALEEAGKESEAFYVYKEAIKLAPNYAKALNNIAFLYEKNGKLTLALFYYQSAVRYSPDYALAWNNLGILYGKRGKHRLEVEAFGNQVRLTPKDPVAHFNLGIACHRAKQYRRAIAAYKKALEIKRDDKPTHWHLANAYERAGVWNLADRHWKKVLELNPTEDEKKIAERHIRENAGR